MAVVIVVRAWCTIIYSAAVTSLIFKRLTSTSLREIFTRSIDVRICNVGQINYILQSEW